MKRLLSTMVMAALLATAGCDDSDPGEADVAAQEELHEDVAADDLAPPEEEVREETDLAHWGAEEIPGTWAQLQIVSTFAEVPLVGQVKTLSKAVVRWQVEATEAGFLAKETVCSLALESDTELAQTVVPAAFVQSIAQAQKNFTVDFGESPPLVSIPKVVQVHGAVLDNPLEDEMPISADDPRVLDQDEDGNPGMTVFVTGLIDGAIYILQRNSSQGDGFLVAPGRMEGLFGWTQEQVMLGSDNPILAENAPVSGVDPDPENSYFVTVKLDEDWDCADIVAHREELF